MSAPGSVREFYKGKNILITGGTGFVGICLLEKILRVLPDHGTIYLLLRPKKGKEISERLDEIKKNQVFEIVLKDKSMEEVFANIQPIAGDVGQDKLGISDVDRKLLKENVNIIIHSAATLDFGETLKTSVDVNLLGTRRVIELARECSHLEALVHISSCYVNSWRSEAEEVVYPLSKDPEELIGLVKKLSPEELEERALEILGNHPNSYTITKHMAEHEVKKLEQEVPCAIVRPSMIVGSWKEPVPGWTISKNGPQGFMMGAAKGIVRRLPVALDLIYDYIPVDIVINNILAAGFYVGHVKPKAAAVFHVSSSTRNPFRWKQVAGKMSQLLARYPLISAVWYPHLKMLPSLLWYKISAIFVHFIPALILDTVLRTTGGRPILFKLHRNVHSSLDRLEKFIFTEWKFSALKTMDLQDWLNKSDQTDFILDISTLSWVDYFDRLALGSRVYLNKDPLKTLPAAKKKHLMLYMVHVVWHLILFALLWFLFASLLGSTMVQSFYILPILFMGYNML